TVLSGATPVAAGAMRLPSDRPPPRTLPPAATVHGTGPQETWIVIARLFSSSCELLERAWPSSVSVGEGGGGDTGGWTGGAGGGSTLITVWASAGSEVLVA